jgi:cell division inhibitor SepF
MPCLPWSITARDPVVVRARTFNDASVVADAYRAGHVVELVLPDDDAGLAQRIVDFATGAVYFDRGSMERLDAVRYRLSPSSANSEGPGS